MRNNSVGTIEVQPAPESESQEQEVETISQEPAPDTRGQEPEPRKQEPGAETRKQEPEPRKQEPGAETRKQEPGEETRKQEPEPEARQQSPEAVTRKQEPEPETSNQERAARTRKQEPKPGITWHKDSQDSRYRGDIEASVDTVAAPKSWWRIILQRDLLMILIIIAVILGFGIGIGINKKLQNMKEPSRTTALVLIGFPGELLMRMLKLLILPLIISSMIVGLAALDQKASGRLGGRALCYYLATTFLAVVLGIFLVLIINPGGKASLNVKKQKQRDVIALDSFLDLLRNLFPPNIVAACFEQAKSTVAKSIEVGNVTVTNVTKATMEGRKVLYNNGTPFYNTYTTIKRSGSVKYSSGTNVLGLIMFSLALGVVAGNMGSKARVFIKFISILNDIVMILVGVVMWYSPIGIWSLITAKFASMKDISSTFQSLGMYILTVILGLVIHAFIVLPTIFFVICRRNPIKYYQGIAQALLTAFGTASSAATLPVTFRCLEENNKIDKRVTRFVLPVGATINMDGTALYEAVAAIFIAQASNYSLDFGQIVSISVTATLASIGAAGIPQAGLVTMLIVLQTVGLPEDSVSLIIAVDWFLDRIRTAVNVLGDSVGAGVVDQLSRKDLQKMDELRAKEEEENDLQDAVETEYIAAPF